MSGSGLFANLTATKRAALVREQGEMLLDEAHGLVTAAQELVVDGDTGRDIEAAHLATVAAALATVGSALLTESRALRDESAW